MRSERSCGNDGGRRRYAKTFVTDHLTASHLLIKFSSMRLEYLLSVSVLWDAWKQQPDA